MVSAFKKLKSAIQLARSAELPENLSSNKSYPTGIISENNQKKWH